MKLKRISRGAAAAAACAGVALLLASCNPSATVDYVFVTSVSNGAGEVSSYHLESDTGVLQQVTGSPVSAQGSNPVAVVASPNQQNLYVADAGSNDIAVFTIGTDGQLAFSKSYTTPGSEPMSLAINSQGTLLFVLDYYAPTYSDASPGPGALVVYPINSDGSLGTPVSSGGSAYTGVQCFPGGLAVSASGAYAYVTNTNSVVTTTLPVSTSTPPATPTGCPTQGTISGFSISSTGVLTPVPGSPFSAGTTPTGIAIDPTNRFVYATDSVQNQLLTFNVETNGSLLPLPEGPVTTGSFPVNVTVDPRGKYVYVSNYNDSTLSEFSITQSSGAPSALATGTFTTKGTAPTCISVEPALGHFLYTSDYTGAYITAANLNPDSGELTGVQASPFPANGFATCVTAIPHGNHANEVVSANPQQ